MHQSDTDMMTLNKNNLQKYQTDTPLDRFASAKSATTQAEDGRRHVIVIILRLGLAQKSVILGTSDRANSGANEIIICSYLICGEVTKL